MSAIIREIYWQEYDTTTQIRSVRADIICDTLADLPSGGIMTDYKLDIGSRAKVIADGSEWQIQSSGSWVRQPSRMQLDLTGYATESYVNTGLAAKVDVTTYTTEQAAQDLAISTVTAAEHQDRAALIGQVDDGAKNLIDPSGFTSQTKNGITLTKNADDSFTITGTFTAHVTSFFVVDNIIGIADTVLAFDEGETGIYAYARNGNPASWLTSSGGVPITTGVPIPDQNVGAQFDIAIMVNNSDGSFDGRVFDKTVRVMICTESDYDISPAFVPYVPTNRELYQMILALQ